MYKIIDLWITAMSRPPFQIILHIKMTISRLGETMKVLNWIIEHIYWIFAMVFLVISGVSFFAYNDVLMALFAYIGFFGCFNLHGISKVECQLEKSEDQE